MRKLSLPWRHQEVAGFSDTVSKALRVTAGLSAAGAYIAAPTGLTAVGVSLGIVSTPVLVAAAPILASAAGIGLTVSAAASLYSKFRSHQTDVRDDKTE